MVCTSCEKSFPTDKSLALHIDANHVATKCRVAWCQKEEGSRIQERLHFKNMHSRDPGGGGRFSEKTIPPLCNICGKTIKSHSGMRYHKKKHLNDHVVEYNGAEETLKSLSVKQEMSGKYEQGALQIDTPEEGGVTQLGGVKVCEIL